MMPLSSIIATFEAEFLARYGDQLLPGQFQALNALKRCRTAASPRMQAQCEDCTYQCYVPHSCGHRLCPHCQHHESEQWLQRQLKRQVPGDYFLLTFTLPAECRGLAWRHQRIVYDALMKCAWQTLWSFSQNDKQLQGTPGAIAVLHTHSRRLDYHPHVHVVMPAAAIDTQKRLWRTRTVNRKTKSKGKSPYLFNHKALAKVFRAKMLNAFTQAGLTLSRRYPEKWVVDCKAVGAGAKALTYLGRYLYRGVVKEKDIVACRNGRVTFRYQDSKTKQIKTRTLLGVEFLRLVLRHVLPRRFRRARNFGFLHPNSKRLIHLLHVLLKVKLTNASAWLKERPTLTCSCCGGAMTIVRTRIAPPRSKAEQPTQVRIGALGM